MSAASKPRDLIVALASRPATIAAVALVAAAAAGALYLESTVARGGVAAPAWVEALSPLRSWWFAAALCVAALVALARVACALEPRGSAGALGLRASLPSNLKEGDVASALGAVAPARVSKDGSYVAQRGRSREAARALLWLAAFAALVATALWAHGREIGVVEVGERDTAYGYKRALSSALVPFDLGAELQVEPLKDARYRVTLGRGADVLATADLGPGDSLRAAGRSLSLVDLVPGHGASAFLLQLDGDATTKRVRLREPLPLRDGRKLAVIAFEADRRVDGASLGPAARLAWLGEAGPSDVGWIYATRADFDAKVRRSSPPVRLAGYERASVLRFKVESGGDLWPFVLPLALVLWGLSLQLGARRRRFVARREGDGWVVRADGEVDTEELSLDLDRILARARVASAR